MVVSMADQKLRELMTELDATLQSGRQISDEDRALLERAHAEVGVALSVKPIAPTPHLRQSVGDALQRLQIEHPRLSNLLSATLDALSDLGV
jgi:Domain of unknown function (DUF4404)